jgi:hypothetical protein
MGASFSSGWVSSGGWSLVPPPPPPPAVNLYGWFAAGWKSGLFYTTVDRITYATDTATASSRGGLDLARYFHTGAGNINYGWFGAGSVASVPAPVSSISRIDYAQDTSVASPRGSLTTAGGAVATGNTNYGWFAGLAGSTNINRIDYALDTATASSRGTLSLGKNSFTASTNTIYGWFGGGSASGIPALSTVDRIDYAVDTATASVRGPLSISRIIPSATSNSNYGWFGAGYNPAPGSARSIVDRIDYAADTATASVRGPLVAAKYHGTSTGDNDYGWFGGGYVPSNSPASASQIDRITYASDTATASSRGQLTISRRNLDATGGFPG